MYANTGYYDNQRVEEMYSDTDFFVHCCGHYRLISRERFCTDRKNGAANYQLLYIADGSASFLIRGSMQRVAKGAFVLYRPHEPQYYEYCLSDHGDVYWVHFSCREDNCLLKQLGFDKETVFQTGAHGDYVRLFDRIIQELQMKREYFAESNQLRLQELLLMIGRNRDRYAQSDFYPYYPQVEAAIRKFHRCPEENFTIKAYAEENNLNYYRFIDSFTRITGFAPRQYIINIRMNKAKTLLGNEAFSVGDVAQLVGYENPLYFSRLFHKTVGVPPSEYRRQVRAEEPNPDKVWEGRGPDGLPGTPGN